MPDTEKEEGGVIPLPRFTFLRGRGVEALAKEIEDDSHNILFDFDALVVDGISNIFTFYYDIAPLTRDLHELFKDKLSPHYRIDTILNICNTPPPINFILINYEEFEIIRASSIISPWHMVEILVTSYVPSDEPPWQQHTLFEPTREDLLLLTKSLDFQQNLEIITNGRS